MALYTLDLDHPKRNVFVTQLRDHEDEDNSDLNIYPIVKESADKLMSTGIKTLQSTRLLKENTDATDTEREFTNKRTAFRKQMAACKRKEQKLRQRQQEITEKVNRFDNFIEETEGKRRRALERYQIEHKMVEQKSQELEIHEEELAKLRKRHEQLQKKVEKYSIYEKYLMKVIEIIPEDYVDNSSDSMMVSIMMRYKTLTSTNKLLNDSLTTLTDKIKFHQQIIHDFQQEYNQQLMMNSSQLGVLQNQLDSYIQKNEKLEHILYDRKETYRKQSSIVGKTKLAVINIAEMCLGKHSQPLNTYTTIDDMLTLIQEFMVEHEAICKMAELLESTRLVHSSFKEAILDVSLIEENILENKKKR